jgi:hypothetical protein
MVFPCGGDKFSFSFPKLFSRGLPPPSPHKNLDLQTRQIIFTYLIDILTSTQSLGKLNCLSNLYNVHYFCNPLLQNLNYVCNIYHMRSQKNNE